VTAVKVDCSRTVLPPLVLRTTTLTSLTGRGSPDPHVNDGEMVSVSVVIGQLYLMNVSTR
jgi:hypothetical protein